MIHAKALDNRKCLCMQRRCRDAMILVLAEAVKNSRIATVKDLFKNNV